MSEQKLEEFLAHYGVLGMQWGKRKSENRVKVASKPAHEDYAQSRKVLKTKLDQVSTRDLKSTNQRLQQEKQLRELRAQNTTLAKGKNQVQSILALTTVAASVYALTKSPLGVKAINQGSAIVGNLMKSKGKHVVGYIPAAIKVVKVAARHVA